MTILGRATCALLSTCFIGATGFACSPAPGGESGGSSSGDTGATGSSSGNNDSSGGSSGGITPTSSDSDGGSATSSSSDGSSGSATSSSSSDDSSSSSDGSSGTTASDTAGGLPSTTFDESACTIFVDETTGMDANSGKAKDQARKTIGAAVSIVAAGDTVCVYPGTYGAFKNTVDGTLEGRIHFVSVERWQAKVTAATTPIQNVGEYVDIDGFEVTTTDESIGVGISNGDGKFASHSRIFNNHVYGIVAKTPGGSGGAGILSAGWVSEFPYQGTDVEIFNNVVHDIGNDGVNAKFVQGIYVSHPHAKVYNNIVYNVSGWGIHGWHNANFVTVSNNLTSNTNGIVLGNGDSPCGKIKCEFTDYFVTNNILYDDRGGIQLYEGPNHLISHNAFFMTEPSGMNALTDDPQLVSYSLDTNGDFHLGAMSPMIDAGSPTYAPAFDFDGKLRPDDGSPDIGPYEH